jgi:4a-hydroxytetrahydrobiopterin dehydratase
MSGLLDDSAIARGLQRLPQWQLEGRKIVRVVNCADFAGALGFVNRVGALAEAANHHPDIDIRWNKVTLQLTTHSKGGLTALDLDLAGRLESLCALYS